MRVELVKINKEVAEQMLSMNINNRKFKDAIVTKYANEMLKGNWKNDTGELIKLSKTNKLLDGQHRLRAIIKANVELSMYVAFDLNDDVFVVLDSGTTRTSNDVFHIAGAQYSSLIPPMIQFSQALNNGNRSNRGNITLTNVELLNKFKENEDYYLDIASKTYGYYVQFAKIMSPTLIGSFMIHFNTKSSADCELFFNELCTGRDVTNNVIYLLRNKLIEDRTGTSKMDREHKNALIIKAWNFYRLRQDVKVLRYNKDVEKSFPIAI
jgi:hypothetical protein